MTKTQFNKLTTPEQCVIVAKDVIAQLQAMRYVSNPGVYVRLHNTALAKRLIKINEGNSADIELQKLLPKIEQCDVCARGALFLSTVRFGNKFKVAEMEQYDGIQTVVREPQVGDRLQTLFTAQQQALIEFSFEGRDVNQELRNNIALFGTLNEQIPKFNKLKDYCLRVFNKYKNPKTRMIAIMKNIVKNNGEFVLFKEVFNV